MSERIEPRRKSPRAPTIDLEEALGRVSKVYDKDRLHSIAIDIAAKHMGYANANNGSALQTLASLRYYGLLDRPRDGFVAVSKEVQTFKFAPQNIRGAIVRRFLATPPLFAELLDLAQGGMPSEETLVYELIQRGFLPQSATTVAAVFRRSVDFVNGFEAPSEAGEPPSAVAEAPAEAGGEGPRDERLSPAQDSPAVARSAPQPTPTAQPAAEEDADRIPVRLSGGRRAWIVVPPVLYAKDKERLKAQIDLLLTAEDEAELDNEI